MCDPGGWVDVQLAATLMNTPGECTQEDGYTSLVRGAVKTNILGCENHPNGTLECRPHFITVYALLQGYSEVNGSWRDITDVHKNHTPDSDVGCSNDVRTEADLCCTKIPKDVTKVRVKGGALVRRTDSPLFVAINITGEPHVISCDEQYWHQTYGKVHRVEGGKSLASATIDIISTFAEFLSYVPQLVEVVPV